MQYVRRPLRGPEDLAAMAALIRSDPRHHHFIDYPYRLCSPAAHAPGLAMLWEDSQGALAGIAIIQTQFWVVDIYLAPEAAPELLIGIVDWAEAFLTESGDEDGKPLYFIFDACDNDPERIAFWEARGLKRADWSHWHCRRQLDEPIPAPGIPAGFTLRPLRPDEAAAYAELHRAAFGTENMTAEWRQRTLEIPEYVPELDLVAEAPDGRLAAFCVLWLSAPDKTGRRLGQVEPLGTHPDFRKLGLGQALLLEGFRRLRERGAASVAVEVDAANDPGLGLYQSVGFRREYAVLKYFNMYGGQPAGESA